MTSRRRTQLGRISGVAIALGGLTCAAEALAAGGPPTKAAAKSFAKAVNLRTGDIPGFKTGAASKTTAADRRMGAAVAKCAGGVDPNRAVYDANSPDFTLASGIVQQDISSEVEILSSSALVAKDLAAEKSRRGRTCLAQALDKVFAGSKITGAKFGKVSVQSTALQANGATGSFAYRFKVTATIHGQKIPYYADALGFTLGRAEVSLSALGFGVPVSSTDELGLFSLLLRRAEAAPKL
ncbi:MAG: hypothetical protein QOH12_1358 [Solirubrobacteraceae bacterium]|jgi:hypothetical protein|nr:hypothetical protein [Solirubrobacteraceae bacterium]